MADDLSFTISAKDQASKAVETVQKKIQDFGKDIGKMALGIAGPMALVTAGFDFVKTKIDEYKQSIEDAKKLNLELADAATKSGKAMTPGQEFAVKKVNDEKTAAEKANIEIKNNEYANAVITENHKKVLDDYIEYRKKIGRALTEEELKQNAEYYDKIGNFAKGYADDIKKFIIERRQAELNTLNEIEQARLNSEKKVQQEKQKTIDIAKIEAETSAIRAETASNPSGKYTPQQQSEQLAFQIEKLTRQRDDTINPKSLDDRKIIDRQIAELEQKKKQLDSDTKNKEDEAAAKLAAEKAKAESKKDIQEKIVLTVSSLREIGGSFGGGDVTSSIDIQIDLAKQALEVQKEIARNTSPQSNVGDSKPIGDTKNFTETKSN